MTHLTNLNILVTGASGFIGTKFLQKSNSFFKNIYCITRKDISIAGYKGQNIIWLKSGDVKNISKIDVVLHLSTSYGRLDEINQVILADVVLPLQIFEIAIKTGCRKIINIDSFFSKDIYSYEYMQEYILAKKFLRNCLKILSKKNSIEIINATLEHVYGPYDNADKFISTTLNKIYLNQKSIELSPGLQKRDFIYIDDVVDAFLTLINHKTNSTYKEIGIGTGISITLKEFLESFKRISKSNTSLNFSLVPYREGEIMESIADNNMLINMGWTPKVSIAQGLELIHKSYLNG